MSQELAELARAANNTVTVGVIASVDPAAGTVVVRTHDRTTAPLPLPAILGLHGRGWHPPPVGAQVVLASASGDLRNAVITAITYTTSLAPPPWASATTSGYQYDNGTSVRYDTSTQQCAVDVVGDVAVTATGPVIITSTTSITLAAPTITLQQQGGTGSLSLGAGVTRLAADRQLHLDGGETIQQTADDLITLTTPRAVVTGELSHG